MPFFVRERESGGQVHFDVDMAFKPGEPSPYSAAGTRNAIPVVGTLVSCVAVAPAS